LLLLLLVATRCAGISCSQPSAISSTAGKYLCYMQLMKHGALRGTCGYPWLLLRG
jgi:hypothetical protein